MIETLPGTVTEIVFTQTYPSCGWPIEPLDEFIYTPTDPKQAQYLAPFRAWLSSIPEPYRPSARIRIEDPYGTGATGQLWIYYRRTQTSSERLRATLKRLSEEQRQREADLVVFRNLREKYRNDWEFT